MSNTPDRVIVPAQPPEWTAAQLGALCGGMSAAAVRYHFRRIKARTPREPLPAAFPLRRAAAQRLLDYIRVRPIKRGRRRAPTEETPP